MPHSAKNLAAWLNEPVYQDAVTDILKRGECPLVLREVAHDANIPISVANRVLGRLHRKGLVERYKLPMQRHRYCHKRKALIPGGARRMLWIYSWIGD